MTSKEHLQVSDILTFRERRLSVLEHTTVARHLLRCVECREQFPLPTPDEFWACLTGRDLEAAETTRWTALKIYLDGSPFGRPAVRNAAFASVLLVAVAALSLSLVFNRFSKPADNVAAVVTDKEPIGKPLSDLGDDHSSGSLANNNGKAVVKGPDSIPPRKKDQSAKVPLSVNYDRRKSKPYIASTGRNSARNIETRGSSTPCGESVTIVLETTATESAVRLTWGKVTGALSYGVFLSDRDEHLIDSYETTDGTAYTVTLPLDPETVYRWKLLVTLKDGKSIVGTSENFKVQADAGSGETRPKIMRLGGKTSGNVRCVENND